MKSHRFAYRNLEQFDFSSAALLVVAEAGRGGSTTQQGSARQGRLRCSREGLGQAFASSETPHGLETFLLNLGLFQLISTELPRFAGLPEVRALFWFLQSSVDMDLFPCEMIFFFMLSFVLYVS